MEQPQWLRLTVLRALAEGALNREEAERMLGEKGEMDQPLTMVERRTLMKIPIAERRRVFAEQAEKIAPSHL